MKPWQTKTVLIALIRAYRTLISPLYPPVCRFHPTCSQYAIEAIAQYGAIRGSWLAVRRVSRCHPFHPGGYDPVPPIVSLLRETGEEERSSRGNLDSDDLPD